MGSAQNEKMGLNFGYSDARNKKERINLGGVSKGKFSEFHRLISVNIFHVGYCKQVNRTIGVYRASGFE